MAITERRAAAVELRVDGRKLSGVVMAYGEVSQSHRERFEPGSLRLADVVHLDLHHDPRTRHSLVARRRTRRSETRKAPFYLPPDLPPIPAADRALDEVRTGAGWRPKRGIPGRKRVNRGRGARDP